MYVLETRLDALDEVYDKSYHEFVPLRTKVS
jgi:hypothetical protein